jgi:hypothetical protein
LNNNNVFSSKDTGAFVTDCRLAFGREGKLVYSNIFRQSIDEKMLYEEKAFAFKVYRNKELINLEGQ